MKGLEAIRADVRRLRKSLDTVGLFSGNVSGVHLVHPLMSVEAELIEIRQALDGFERHAVAIEREAAENSERLQALAAELANAGWKQKETV